MVWDNFVREEAGVRATTAALTAAGRWANQLKHLNFSTLLCDFHDNKVSQLTFRVIIKTLKPHLLPHWRKSQTPVVVSALSSVTQREPVLNYSPKEWRFSPPEMLLPMSSTDLLILQNSSCVPHSRMPSLNPRLSCMYSFCASMPHRSQISIQA